MAKVPITHRALTAEEQSAVEQGLELAARLVRSPVPLGFEEVQKLYDAMLVQAELDEEDLIALGIAFGAAIIERAGFHWVRVSDQWGDETCVGPAHKTIHCAPISMVQKRLDRKEPIGVEQLANTVISSIRSQLADGDAGDW